MNRARPFGQIFPITLVAALLGFSAFHMTDLVTLYLKGVGVQGIVVLEGAGWSEWYGYRYMVEGKEYRTSSGLVLPVNRLSPGQTVALNYLKTNPAKALAKDDFLQGMIETGLGILLTAGGLALMRWRIQGAVKRKQASTEGTQ